MTKLEKQYMINYFSEFIQSDFYDERKRFNEQISGREYKEFCLQKSRDYQILYNTLIYLKYAEEIDLGRILEVSKGPMESVANFDEDEEFNFLVLSQYGTEEIFKDSPFDYRQGIITSMSMQSKEDFDWWNTYIRYIGKINKETYPKFKDFDTIINLCDINTETLYATFINAISLNKFVIVGSVSNIFDKNLEEKSEAIEEIYNIIKEDCEKANIQDIQNNGTVLKLINNF